ncbi:type IX secretion system membrane protein PorP/SprF [Flavobacterium sp. '19STA2R22 D10 B1']|uniref:PorP/SprF family type IX secretion system membrane protein n=1 Tax=Flavobacterium aerium TaxID=3037261 RepID=UPI00278C83AD|nr:type IX secretion system membrane protein PorP/SprF [Flavobacterium sp. '19STA2R22 D10 B1']
MKKILIALLFVCYAQSYGQQDVQYTQYMYNTINVNPAYAGSREVMSIFGMHRTQWVGLDGAPVTNTASIHAPLNDTKIGLGLSIISDRIGPSRENDISVDFSYTLDLENDFKLAFGLKATANLFSIDYTKLNIYTPTDTRFQYNINNKFSPNIGAGVYLYSENSYIGFSIPNMLETKHYDKKSGQDAASYVSTDRLHYYLIAGHVFDVNDEFKFKPTLLTKMVQGAPLQVDLSANVLFQEKFSAGVAYRWNAAMSAMVGYQVSDSWFIGYSYDAESTKLANYNSGSHELFLRFELFENYDRIVSPRYF